MRPVRGAIAQSFSVEVFMSVPEDAAGQRRDRASMAI
ncbi:hypothetical protein EMIT0196MI5_30045 [Pseudomonas sp. IT-196MI5]